MAHREVYGMQAIADHFGVKMYIITSYREGEIIEINPIGRLRSERVLYLSFWAEVRSFLPQKLLKPKPLSMSVVHHCTFSAEPQADSCI